MESFSKDRPKLVGILNVTPDSFSDGGRYLEQEKALAKAKLLKQEGADVIDIGADSSRRGSVCAGVEEELRRLGDLVKEISAFCPVSVDTHHSEVAKAALHLGASFINDISSGSDPAMFEVLASSKASIILTHTVCTRPHEFGPPKDGDLIGNILKFFEDKLERLAKLNVSENRIILDPGMGAFLGPEASFSWELLARIDELRSAFSYPLLLGISRKGFLKVAGETSPDARDLSSAYLSALVLRRSKIEYLRVHNVSLHSRLFSALGV